MMNRSVDEFESALFEPVVILPSQISVDAPWVSHTSGPIALMLAVLEDAARCLERGRRRRHPGVRKLAAKAEAWVRCDSREWPFAFASICDVLGLDVDAVRARLLAEGKYLTGGLEAAASALPFSSVEAFQRGCEAFCAQ